LLLGARANVLEHSQLQRVHTLAGRTIQTQQDILDAASAARRDVGQCLLELMDATEGFLLRLENFNDLVSISLDMQTDKDEFVVLFEIHAAADEFLKSINLSRRAINLATGCSTNAVLGIKAQQALTLLDAAVPLVTEIRDRSLSMRGSPK
jgi:hypothetical protein